MYNNQYLNPYYNQNFQPSMPQYNYSMNSYQQQTTPNTNKIYVSGIDDVRKRTLQPNSDYIFLDNDKPILYQKIVSSNGQFEVKAFEITPYNAQNETKDINSVDLSSYVKKSDLEPLEAEIKALKDKLIPQEVKIENGNI